MTPPLDPPLKPLRQTLFFVIRTLCCNLKSTCLKQNQNILKVGQKHFAGFRKKNFP